MNKWVYEHDGEEDAFALVAEDAESALRCEIAAPGRSAKASASRETCFHVATVGAERRGWRRARRNVEGELDEVSKARGAVRPQSVRRRVGREPPHDSVDPNRLWGGVLRCIIPLL